VTKLQSRVGSPPFWGYRVVQYSMLTGKLPVCLTRMNELENKVFRNFQTAYKFSGLDVLMLIIINTDITIIAVL